MSNICGARRGLAGAGEHVAFSWTSAPIDHRAFVTFRCAVKSELECMFMSVTTLSCAFRVNFSAATLLQWIETFTKM